jgi:hypothetical protein
MGRLVEPRRTDGGLFSNGPSDDYLSRVAKYVPAEFVAIYLTLDKITKPEASWNSLALAIQNEALREGAFVFVALFALNITY